MRQKAELHAKSQRMKISPNLTLAEVSKSNTAIKLGIDNEPKGEHLNNMIHTANAIFQPIRNHFGKPIFVSSGYRSPELNKAIAGAASNSQHCKGEALDLDNDAVEYPTNKDIFEYIKNHLDFDQLIWEFGSDSNPAWVHVSYNKDKNRKQVLRALKVNGKTIYQPYTEKP
jgi:zinc D-Ala-D-Ala carboxypeptidase